MKYLKIFIASLFIFSCRKDFTEINASTEKITRTATNEKWVKDEVLVKFKANEANIIKLYGYAVKEKILTKAMEINGDPGFFVLKVPDVSNAIEVLRNNPNVTYVEPNYIIQTNQTYPNDPYFTDLWGMKNMGADKVWPNNKGSQQVYVGVSDEGAYWCHNDLNGQVRKELSYDYMHNDSSVFDGADQHGTHVSGTIGAHGNNSIGVIGVSPLVSIAVAKFLETNGTVSNAIKTIDHFTYLKTQGYNFVAVNCSWGGGPYTQGLKDAITRAGQSNILIVCAAGNNATNIDVTTFYPAGYDNDNIISVAAIDPNSVLSTFSNYGATSVDIAAPGQGILSTTYGASGESTYTIYNGTSMAAPHVTGAIALYAASHPGENYQQIKSAILNSARKVTSLTGKCVTGGVLNIAGFTQSYSENPAARSYVCNVAPLSPVNVQVSAITDTQLSFTWEKPSDHDNQITGYEGTLTYYDGRTQVLSTPNLTLSFYNLPPGMSFSFVVKSIGGGFKSQPSQTVTASTTGSPDTQPPTVPTDLKQDICKTSDCDSNYMIPLSWTSSCDNYVVSGYEIDIRRVGTTTWTTYYVDWAKQCGTNHYTYLIQIGSLFQPATCYEVRIRSIDNSRNKSAYSDVVIMHTAGGQCGITPPPPPPVSDTIPPVITSLSTTKKGKWNLQINTSASDNVGVTKMEIWINNSLMTSCSGSLCSYTWNTRNVQSGSYTITARAKDAAGNTGSKTITVVKN